MLLTVYQKRILEILAEIPYIRQNQLLWLMQTQFGTNQQQLNRDLGQLCYLGQVTMQVDRGGIIKQPRCRRDDLLLRAVDVMMEVCGDSRPAFIKGEPPCKLSFYLRDARGYLDFKVVPVPEGEEQMILSALETRYRGFSCTYLFLLQGEEQIERIKTENPACYVLSDGKSGYLFVKKRN